MPQKIKPTKIIYTQAEGEVRLEIDHKIELELTIHIDGNGSVKTEVKNAEKEEKVNYEIPDFSGIGSINFGKEVK